MTKEDEEGVRFSTIESNADLLHTWSNTRVKIIKKAFKDILDFMICKEHLCIASIFKKMNTSEYKRRVEKQSTIKGKLMYVFVIYKKSF